MKNKLILSLLLTGAVVAGCVSSVPQVSTNPATGLPVTNTVYVASPQIASVESNALVAGGYAAGIASLVPVAAPLAPAITPLLTSIFALFTLGSGVLAAYKNKQATTHANAAAALASSIANNSTAQASALSAAALNGSTAAVATHIQNAQSPV